MWERATLGEFQCVCEDHLAAGVELNDDAVLFMGVDGKPAFQATSIPEDEFPEFVALMGNHKAEVPFLLFRKVGMKTWQIVLDMGIVDRLGGGE